MFVYMTSFRDMDGTCHHHLLVCAFYLWGDLPRLTGLLHLQTSRFCICWLVSRDCWSYGVWTPSKLWVCHQSNPALPLSNGSSSPQSKLWHTDCIWYSFNLLLRTLGPFCMLEPIYHPWFIHLRSQTVLSRALWDFLCWRIFLLSYFLLLITY